MLLTGWKCKHFIMTVFADIYIYLQLEHDHWAATYQLHSNYLQESNVSLLRGEHIREREREKQTEHSFYRTGFVLLACISIFGTKILINFDVTLVFVKCFHERMSFLTIVFVCGFGQKKKQILSHHND